MNHDLENLTVPQLLKLHAGIADELRRRGITRSANNPLGDLAEHLFCRAFGWQMAEKSMRDCDATGRCGTRYQIKSRRITSQNPSRQLGALRSLHDHNFDVLAAALFNEDFSVMRAALIPYELVIELAKRVEHTNSWRFLLRDSVWSMSGVKDVTLELCESSASLATGRVLEVKDDQGEATHGTGGHDEPRDERLRAV